MQEIDLTPEREQEQMLAEEAGAVDIDLSANTEGIEALVQEVQNVADEFRVSDFKCVKCDLAHGHDTDKHRASGTYGMTHKEAASMEFNPNCHCGLHNVAHEGEKYGIEDGPTPQEAADRAPVPDDVQSSLR